MDKSAREAYVRFSNVQKSYDGVNLVVKDLNLDVQRGEFMTMLGPSGSGKTTCLMMLAGFETATSGDIILDSDAINDVPPWKRDIGIVFQNYALFPHMTVQENLAYPMQVRKVPKSEITDRVKKALGMVQLDGFAGRRPGQLSGGQQQRVAVARALVFEPKLVLMDEPLGALDRQLREQMQYEIKHIHENLGVTVVYVTHDQAEALTMSNRVCVFDDGVVQQVAAPNILYEQPDNAFVAQFIGENNTFTAIVKEVNGDQCLTQVDTGETLTSLAINIGKPGTKTTLSLRPERVTINPEAGECKNVVSGMVKELIYLGDHIRTRLALCGQEDFIVKVQNAARHSHLSEGETVQVGWHVEDCRALDAL